MQTSRLYRPVLILFFTLLFILCGCSGRQAVHKSVQVPLPAAGKALPALTLTAPQAVQIRDYLGLPKSEHKTINPGEISGDILLLELFSMYCPYCQREAPAVNELYQLIQSDEKLSARIKMIGIGIGNSAFEVGIFQKKYAVEFPLFADEDYTIYRNVGQVRTPFFIAIHNRGPKKNLIFYAKAGNFGNPENFLEILQDLASR